MATIIIRNLDDAVAERLRLQARLRGVSVEQEAGRLLTEATALGRREIAARAAAIRARQPRHKSRAAALIREARRGLVTLGEANDPRLYRRLARLVPAGTAKRLLDAERGNR